MNTPVLAIDDLSVGFRGRSGTTDVLRGVSLRIAPGEIVGLVGESGSGKSTTPAAALGLLPRNAIVAGAVEIAGTPVDVTDSASAREAVRGKAAVIFQQPMRAFSPYDTLERQIVDAVRAQTELNRRDARAAVLAEFSQVKMPDPDLALRKYPHQLSGGQLQRAMIAMAFACRPQLLVCDEPTTALDVTVQAQVISLIRTLARENGVGALFITHDLAVVSEICDRVYVMYAGRIAEENDVVTLLRSPRHRYARALINSTPIMGETRRFSTIPGQAPSAGAAPPGCAFAPRCSAAVEACRSTPPPFDAFRGGRFACHNPEEPWEISA